MLDSLDTSYELLDLNYKEYPFFEICTADDQETIADISNASLYVKQNDFSFGIFDLRLSDYDKFILSQLVIESPFGMSNCDDFNNITKLTTDFMKQIEKGGKNDLIAVYIGKLVNRIVNNIIDASYYNNAYVFIRAFVNSDMHGESNTSNYYKNTSLDWHIDKTIEEIVSGVKNATYTQPDTIHLFTLKGASTLYQITNITVHKQFLEHAYNGYMTYEHQCNLFACDPNSLVFEMFKDEEARSYDFGYGSVHLSGKEKGAVHAIPNPHNRMTVIVIPEEEMIIKDYCDFKDQLSRNWMKK